MRNTVQKQKFDAERTIIHELLLRSSLIQDIGLLQGKMGLVIFFMYYHQYTKEALYEDVANELLDEIVEGLHKDLPITFDSGLPGIGWGIDYLIHKGFIGGDSKEICEEIDHKIMETDPRRMTDYSFETGLGGILLYVLTHNKTVSDQKQDPPFDTTYLNDLYTACVKARSDNTAPTETQELIECYITSQETRTIPNYSIWNFPRLTQGIQDFNERKVTQYSLGIKQGLAGALLEKYPVLNNEVS